MRPIYDGHRRGSPGRPLSCLRCPRASLSPSYNAAPSQGLPAILSANPHTITLSTWGFLPEWADGRPDVKPLINARAETVATKPFFRQAFRTKRCLVLADGFYEWKRTGKGKVPYRIALKTDEPFAFAGIWSTVHDAQGRPSDDLCHHHDGSQRLGSARSTPHARHSASRL